MPVMRCQKDDRPGFKCGNGGFCYTYDPGDPRGAAEARRSAVNQCIAIGEPVTDGVNKGSAVANAHLLLLLSRSINKADAPTKFVADFEAALTTVLSSEWTDQSDRGVRVAMSTYRRRRRKRNAATVKAIESSLARAMAGFGRDVAKVIENSFEVFYKEVTRRFIVSEGLKVEKAERVPGIGVSFSQADQDAIRVIQKLTVQTAGRYFPDQVSRKTSEVIERVVLNEGLTVEQAAVRLEQELRGALGATGFDEAVPKQFANNPQSYFTIVSQNASVQATNVGRVLAMSDAGIEKYVVRAIIDKRTSEICKNLNGKEFSVATARGAVSNFLELNTLSGLENMMPFSRTDTVPAWADKGEGFPPFHQKCRTTVVPV